MTAPDSAELELKLRLPAAAIADVLRHPAVLAVKRGRMRTAAMHATYYDTADLRLARARVGLRVRREGRRWRQTVKGPADAQSGGGMTHRPEYEWPLPGTPRDNVAPPLDRARFADTPWRRKLDKAARHGLLPMFTTVFVRRSVPLVFADSTMATLCIDEGVIRAGQGRRVERLCEIEIELESGLAHNLFELAAALATDVPLAIETRSKAARGYALRTPAARVPARAEDVALDANASAANALVVILRNCARQIEANADGLVADDDPEWVHQMRIGTRRMRACLALMRDVVPASTLDPVASEARWLAGILGTARDLDVLVGETLPAIAKALRNNHAGPGDGAPLRALRRRVLARSKGAREDARAAVASTRFTRLLLAVGALAARPQFGVGDGTPAAATLAGRARRLARPVLEHRQQRLLRRGDGLPDLAPPARHAARLAAKRLRYAAEFFAVLFPRRRARAYLVALEALQDILGALNDASVAAHLARDVAGPDATATATLQGWAAAQAAVRADGLRAAWHHFTRARPFWSQR